MPILSLRIAAPSDPLLADRAAATLHELTGTEALRHAGKAALAAATALSTSATEARPTAACCSPVAGL